MRYALSKFFADLKSKGNMARTSHPNLEQAPKEKEFNDYASKAKVLHYRNH